MATKSRPRTAATVLKELRAERGLTQEQLEAQTGISQTLISQIENGSRRMTWATASRLELAMGLQRGSLDDVADQGDLGTLPAASPIPGLLDDLSYPETAATTGNTRNLVDDAAA